MLHGERVHATCLAKAWRNKFHEKLHRVTWALNFWWASYGTSCPYVSLIDPTKCMSLTLAINRPPDHTGQPARTLHINLDRTSRSIFRDRNTDVYNTQMATQAGRNIVLLSQCVFGDFISVINTCTKINRRRSSWVVELGHGRAQ